MTYTVLLGQMFHETHGFNPVPTVHGDMSISRDCASLEKARGTGSALAGMLDFLERSGHQVLPSVCCFGPPSGPVEHALYEELKGEILAAAASSDFDAIALDLHGAMGTTELDDAEGDLLKHLREVVGPDVPIAVALDMHGHVTKDMLEAANVMLACKTCPHVDFPQSGEKAARLLVAKLDRLIAPVTVCAKAPMITLDKGLTDEGPLAEITSRAASVEAKHDALLDVSILSVYRNSDFKEQKGQTVLITADGSSSLAVAEAEAMAHWFWFNKERFQGDGISLDEALDAVVAGRGGEFFVLGDLGDRTIAGAPGDSLVIFEAALRRSEGLRFAVPLADAAAAGQAIEAGLGASVSLMAGGMLTPGLSPVKLCGKVVHIGTGRFIVDGPVFDGEQVDFGPSAVLEIRDGVFVLLTSRGGLTHTPAAFTSQGIDLGKLDFVVSKSGQHFQANFAGLARPLFVNTPGLTFPGGQTDVWSGPPFWPEHEVAHPDLKAQIFGG